MHRTNIFLKDRQVAALDAQARREGVTRAEVIRRLVDMGLARLERDLERDLAALDESFGALRADDVDVDRGGDLARQEHLDRVWRS